ncbi:hypothetical protein WCE39_07955 [Luteimonas sp. MJ174]|uniref:hypothetical protein n=1 Tax=Luteimonas sp. MJ174 TaxID=3129237 RepID=UPI0031BA6685
MASKTYPILEAVGVQLAAIRVDAGFNTDIGTNIFLDDRQREGNARPSICIGSRSGRISRSDERNGSGRVLSAKARGMDLIIEAAMSVGADGAHDAGHEMLEDIERSFDARTCAAPLGVIDVRLDSWQILDRPDGIDAAVLQILGSVDYVRK